MLDNHIYNLMNQMVEENKAAWRIHKMYKSDSEGCPDCTAFWEMLEKDKDEHIKEIEGLLKKHM